MTEDDRSRWGSTFDDTRIDQPTAIVDGWGISVTVKGGYLIAHDGGFGYGRVRRWSRADRTLRRLLILGEGYVTTAALRWCRAIGVSIAMIDNHGIILAAGPTGYDDARLRRAQATAYGSPVGIRIAGLLIAGKLEGHARTARNHLQNEAAAASLDGDADTVRGAETLDEIRTIEAVASQHYWAAWPGDAVRFIGQDAKRIPTHWTRFDGRRNPISGRNARAIQPANAMLNYLYRLIEIEARLAAVAVGLDPGLGFIHADHPGRDALALDLMEPIRAEAEAYALRLFSDRRFRRADFGEQPDGTVRILPPLSHQLAATLPVWGRAVAPWAEKVAHALQETIPGRTVKRTPLTSARRKEAVRRAHPSRMPKTDVPLPPAACRECGVVLPRADYLYCTECRSVAFRERARAGVEGQRRAREAWTIGDIDRARYVDEILPRLRTLRSVDIVNATGCSLSSASYWRSGRVPDPRWWPILAELTGVQSPEH